jgi:hypothetical protein
VHFRRASQVQFTPASWRNDVRTHRRNSAATRENLDARRAIDARTGTQDRGTIRTRISRRSANRRYRLGPAIVAVNNQRKAGTTNFLVIQKRDAKFRVTAQGRLDKEGFSHASWSAEQVDADEDGYQELLFTGKDSSESAKHETVDHLRAQRQTDLFMHS